MVNIPASNRIHSLPVVVNYHLPTASSSFTTLFNSPQQVYVHANAATKSSAEVETWGSIYLKTVVQGVLLASPELHPFEASTPDTSLYVLDPRETYSRRQRSANLPAHLRSDRGSSPAAGPSSPLNPPAPEVWAGKGLLSWALQEAGQGKNLITGRLVRSTEFASVSAGGLNALEALMASSNLEGVWGLEVNLSLRTQGMPMTGPLVGLGSAAVMERNASSSSISEVGRRSSVMSETPVAKEENTSEARLHVPSSVRPTPPTTRLPPRQPHTAERPRIPSTQKPDSTPSISRHQKGKARTSTGKKRKSAASADQPDRALVDIPMNTSTLARVNSYDPSKYLPSIPAAVYNNPSSLTKDQVHRLLASPAFLDLLEKTAGQTLDEAKRNAVSSVVGDLGTAAKRVKHDHAEEAAAGGLKCYNCGRTKSSVWRSREMEDGVTVKVCNACGLYWNQRKEMRPPSLWTAVDEDIAPRPPTTKKKAAARRSTGSATPSVPDSQVHNLTAHAAAFKRTLSAVVNQDAERIAARRPHASTSVSAPAATLPRSNLHISKTAPATSPVQPTRPKTVRNASWKNTEGHVASSPGGWVQPNTRAVRANEAFEPMSTIGESPALSSTTTLAFNTQSQIQSLQLPLSDDQTLGNSWDTDISTLFDIDAYSERFEKDFPAQPLRRSPRKHSQRAPISRHSDSHSDPISNLFTASSSSTAASPKSSFDFSALPPSSPPFMMRENTASSGTHLGHSALLLSSPEFSPLSSMFGPSPVEGPRLTPEKNKSGLRNSFTLEQNFGLDQNGQVQGQGQYGLGVGMGANSAVSASIQNQQISGQPMMSIEEITQVLNDSGMDQAAWDELFGLIGDGTEMNGATTGGLGQALGSGVQGFEGDIIAGAAGMGGINMGMTGMETVQEDEWTALLNTLGS